MIAGAFGLTRENRLDIATTLFNREVSSWSDLDDRELHTLRWGLECSLLVAKIHLDRRAAPRTAAPR